MGWGGSKGLGFRRAASENKRLERCGKKQRKARKRRFCPSYGHPA